MSTQNKTQDPLAAEIQRLRAENEALKAQAAQKAQGRVTMSVSSKGALSVYGLGRFPITLYIGQWKTLFSVLDVLKGFLAEGEKLGAFQTDKDKPFVQPNNLPLKFRAKQASDAKSSDAL